METYADIIALWPTVAEYASDVRVKPALAAVWKHRNKIPPSHWISTVEAAKRRGFSGVTLLLLATFASVKRSAEEPCCKDSALLLAIEVAGGVMKLSRKIGVTSPAISQWERVPVGRVLAVEAATGISRHLLRPDIFGSAPSSTETAA